MKVLVFFLLFGNFAYSLVNENQDIQLWIQQQTSLPVFTKGKLFLDAETRIGDEVSKLYYIHMEALALFPLTSYWEIGPGYRQIWRQKGNTFKPIYQPETDLIVKTTQGKIKLLSRSRFSYQIRQEGRNTFEYRLLAMIRFRYYLSPFLSNEFFVDSRRYFFQNRFTLGVLTPVLPSLKINTFYLLRSLKNSGKWNLNHIFGFYIKAGF